MQFLDIGTVLKYFFSVCVLGLPFWKFHKKCEGGKLIFFVFYMDFLNSLTREVKTMSSVGIACLFCIGCSN